MPYTPVHITPPPLGRFSLNTRYLESWNSVGANKNKVGDGKTSWKMCRSVLPPFFSVAGLLSLEKPAQGYVI